MKVEFLVINGDDCVGVVYKHEKFGRILSIRGNMNPEFPLEIYDVEKDSNTIKLDLFDFIVQAFPKEPSNDKKTEASS